jgi:hypothetical protein
MLPEHWADFRRYEAALLSQGQVPMTYNEWCKANGHPYTRSVTALDGNGHSIITITAYDEADALAKVEDQLTRNPSRYWYFDRWVAAGRPIRWAEEVL